MEALLEVHDLKVRFGRIKAVDGVSFSIRRGETLGVVGESGSGKSTIARVITGIAKPASGRVALSGKVAMIFQDPLGSLNPRMTVRATIGEVIGLSTHTRATAAAIVKYLELVGLDASALDKYPHEFSGGERQRVCIARAIATKPDLLICDEAVSALDLSIRAQILDLLLKLKTQLSLSMLFITHDLGVVQHLADRILVMNRGKIVEEGPAEEVLRAPRAEYTAYLIHAVPKIGKPLT